jgi:hypothetical protein
VKINLISAVYGGDDTYFLVDTIGLVITKSNAKILITTVRNKSLLSL